MIVLLVLMIDDQKLMDGHQNWMDGHHFLIVVHQSLMNRHHFLIVVLSGEMDGHHFLMTAHQSLINGHQKVMTVLSDLVTVSPFGRIDPPFLWNNSPKRSGP